ncbi:MAG: hypothetical protein NTV48_01135 [Candidatus Vogelbacteria bacterium]|nr:hypothetical protein [Candidatus Vogelbacteria bacterium]
MAVIAILLMAVAVLVWRDFSRVPTSVQTLTTEQSGVSKTDQPAPVVPVAKTKAPIVPESELDRKLRKGGFGPFSRAHRIAVN